MKLKEVYLLDENDCYKGTTFVPEETPDTDTMISTPLPDGLHRYKYDHKSKKWVEGMTQEEIEALPPIEPTLAERLNNMQAVLDKLLIGGGANG